MQHRAACFCAFCLARLLSFFLSTRATEISPSITWLISEEINSCHCLLSRLVLCIYFVLLCFPKSPADNRWQLFWKHSSNEQDAGPKKLWNASSPSQQWFVSNIMRLVSPFQPKKAEVWSRMCFIWYSGVHQYIRKIGPSGETAIISRSATFNMLFHINQ